MSRGIHVAAYRRSWETLSWLAIAAVIAAVGVTVALATSDNQQRTERSDEPLRIEVTNSGTAVPENVADSLQGASGVNQAGSNTLQQSSEISDRLQPNSGRQSF